MLNLGENYNEEIFYAGDVVITEKPKVELPDEVDDEKQALPLEEDKPKILFFEPKQGYQTSC